jgi:hypothetical protein
MSNHQTKTNKQNLSIFIFQANIGAIVVLWKRTIPAYLVPVKTNSKRQQNGVVTVKKACVLIVQKPTERTNSPLTIHL